MVWGESGDDMVPVVVNDASQYPLVGAVAISVDIVEA